MDLNLTNVSEVKRVGKKRRAKNQVQVQDSNKYEKMSSTCFSSLEINGSSEVNCRKRHCDFW